MEDLSLTGLQVPSGQDLQVGSPQPGAHSTWYILGSEWENSHAPPPTPRQPGPVTQVSLEALNSPGDQVGGFAQEGNLLLSALVTRTWVLTQAPLRSPLSVESVSWLEPHLSQITRFLHNSACALAGSYFVGSRSQVLEELGTEAGGDKAAQPRPLRTHGRCRVYAVLDGSGGGEGDIPAPTGPCN